MNPGAEPPKPALVTVRIGDRDYPVVTRPNCRTCTHPDRAEIEHKIMSGYAYTAIATWLKGQETDQREADPGSDPPHAPGPESLRNHASTHMSLAGNVQRALIDRRAGEINLDVDAELVVDHIAMSRLVVKMGMEGLADGTIKPDMGDIMNAAKFLAANDIRDDGPDTDAWREALMAYMEVARQFIPATNWPAFSMALRDHPALRRTTTPALPPATERTAQP